jgi:hypothetical protein
MLLFWFVLLFFLFFKNYYFILDYVLINLMLSDFLVFPSRDMAYIYLKTL